MRHAIVTVAVLVVQPVLCGWAAATTVFEGKQEVLVLDSWAAPKRWAVAECTVTGEAKRLADGRPTIRMHVPVDHHAGEKKYPIGWPRAWFSTVQAYEKDWTAFERLEFKVYTTASCKKLPRTPITLIVSCPGRKRQWTHSMRELKVNEWVAYSLPISKMKYVDTVKTVKFSISESSYKHGDKLDFYIGGFRLVRSTECTLNELAMKGAAVYQGAAVLDVTVDVAGVAKGISRAVPFTIRCKDKVVRRENLPVRRGRYTMAMDIAELKLEPGTYTLVAFDGDAARRKAVEFRVTPNPWKEK